MYLAVHPCTLRRLTFSGDDYVILPTAPALIKMAPLTTLYILSLCIVKRVSGELSDSVPEPGTVQWVTWQV